MLYCAETSLGGVIVHTVLHLRWIGILGTYRIDCGVQNILCLLHIKETGLSSHLVICNILLLRKRILGLGHSPELLRCAPNVIRSVIRESQRDLACMQRKQCEDAPRKWHGGGQ